ncbi:hypothetical protein [Bosea sp. AS-1]|uniref:hypothetical protein n=1 Tax=Bosea sp. AS-1 TaxID=2015316 RepID=UPI000B7961F7|nr:hypothetical protein [Bosea sp. AS-1]
MGSNRADDAFILLRNAADVARAKAALEKSWALLRGSIPKDRRALDRKRLTYIVVSCALATNDPDNLIFMVMKRFDRMRDDRFSS